jgi:hypothetical protein
MGRRICLGVLVILCVAASAPSIVPVVDGPRDGGRSLFACLWARRSTRQFLADPLPEGALTRILWAADGVNRADGNRRTAPSAFECYPVTLYVVERSRIVRFSPVERALVPIAEDAGATRDYRRDLLGSSAFAAAPALLYLTVDTAKFPERATPAMRMPWAHAECGAIGQNVYLACADLGLGTVFSAGTGGEPVKRILGLAGTEEPCYVMPIGKPAP